jgi:hypothetical protein
MNPTQGPRAGQLPQVVRQLCRNYATGSQGRPKTGFIGPKGHGENIWVYTHRRSQQIIYSFDSKLNQHHDLKQFPFNGKKTKPAGLRKDYWYPMAKIQFAPGQGSIGRSVFQKLRELKHLHEVSWGDDVFYKSPEEYTAYEKKKVDDYEKAAEEAYDAEETESADVKPYRPVRSKAERGAALNAQKPNSVADMAAVLSGLGKGNKMLLDARKETLADVTIQWTSELDREYAEEWSDNVTHDVLPKQIKSVEAEAETELATVPQ